MIARAICGRCEAVVEASMSGPLPPTMPQVGALKDLALVEHMVQVHGARTGRVLVPALFDVGLQVGLAADGRRVALQVLLPDGASRWVEASTEAAGELAAAVRSVAALVVSDDQRMGPQPVGGVWSVAPAVGQVGLDLGTGQVIFLPAAMAEVLADAVELLAAAVTR